MIAGGDPDSFWSQTLATVHAVLSASKARIADRWKDEITLAWTVAALGRMKDLPDLDDLLPDAGPRQGQVQTDEEMNAALLGWCAVIDANFPESTSPNEAPAKEGSE